MRKVHKLITKRYPMFLLVIISTFAILIMGCSRTSDNAADNNEIDPALNGTWVSSEYYHYRFRNGLFELFHDYEDQFVWGARGNYRTSGDRLIKSNIQIFDYDRQRWEIFSDAEYVFHYLITGNVLHFDGDTWERKE